MSFQTRQPEAFTIGGWIVGRSLFVGTGARSLLSTLALISIDNSEVPMQKVVLTKSEALALLGELQKLKDSGALDD